MRPVRFRGADRGFSNEPICDYANALPKAENSLALSSRRGAGGSGCERPLEFYGLSWASKTCRNRIAVEIPNERSGGHVVPVLNAANGKYFADALGGAISRWALPLVKLLTFRMGVARAFYTSPGRRRLGHQSPSRFLHGSTSLPCRNPIGFFRTCRGRSGEV